MSVNKRKRSSGVEKFDRVLGGGFVPGSVILFTGPVGAGRTTLLMSVAAWSLRGKQRARYVTTTQAVSDALLYAQRLKLDSDRVEVTDWDEDEVFKPGVSILVVDTITGLELSPKQHDELFDRLCEFARETQAVVFVVANLTKRGDIKGGTYCEHVADVIAGLTPIEDTPIRRLWVDKNRHDCRPHRDKVAYLEMTECGFVS